MFLVIFWSIRWHLLVSTKDLQKISIWNVLKKFDTTPLFTFFFSRKYYTYYSDNCCLNELFHYQCSSVIYRTPHQVFQEKRFVRRLSLFSASSMFQVKEAGDTYYLAHGSTKKKERDRKGITSSMTLSSGNPLNATYDAKPSTTPILITQYTSQLSFPNSQMTSLFTVSKNNNNGITLSHKIQVSSFCTIATR